MTGVIGYTFGSFDLMHAGHSVFFRDCRKHCDLLFVGLHTDPSTDRSSKNKPVQTVYERYVQLINCQWVDHVIPYETEADLNGLTIYLGLGYPIKEAYSAFIDTFIGYPTEQNKRRYDIINRFIKDYIEEYNIKDVYAVGS